MFSEDIKTYVDARTFCNQFPNGRLFVADSVEKAMLVRVVHTANGDGEWRAPSIYIGLDDLDTDLTFVWADGRVATPEEFSEMFKSQPTTVDGIKHCVIVRKKNGLLSVVNCYERFYVCEIVVSG